MLNTNMNIGQFLMKVNVVLNNNVVSSEKLRRALVPIGIINTAAPRGFGKRGIYKYTFTLCDGTCVQVKCHIQHLEAKGGPTCNSYCSPTLQIYTGTLRNNGKFKPKQYLVWDPQNHVATFHSKQNLWNSNNLINWSHIPVIWTSERALTCAHTRMRLQKRVTKRLLSKQP